MSHVALLAAAAFYVVSPLDFMPEAFFGVLGIADDAVVVSWLVAALVNDTEAFLDWERGTGRSGHAGSAGWAESHAYAGPQDMSSDEYHRTVRSQVVG